MFVLPWLTLVMCFATTHWLSRTTFPGESLTLNLHELLNHINNGLSVIDLTVWSITWLFLNHTVLALVSLRGRAAPVNPHDAETSHARLQPWHEPRNSENWGYVIVDFIKSPTRRQLEGWIAFLHRKEVLDMQRYQSLAVFTSHFTTYC